MNFSSWALDFAKEVEIECVDNMAKKVRCYNPEYTFVEKLSAISSKFRKYQDEKKIDRNFLRHYYDIFMLLKRRDVKDFIGTKDYYLHKEKKFRKSDEKDLSMNEAFLMREDHVFKFFQEKYKENKPLHYDDKMPEFLDIIEAIRAVAHRL